MLALLLAGFLATPVGALIAARDAQDRAALGKIVEEYSALAAKTPNDPEAHYRVALACSYLAEVTIEMRDRKLGQQVAERGIKEGEKALSMKPGTADYYRVLGILYGQAIVDISSGMSYGPKAKEAINQAVERAPKATMAYVARGVGNYYLPALLGGGPKVAMEDFRKAIELDPQNADAYLWLGLSLRKENRNAEARDAFAKSLQYNPRRIWTKQQLDKTPAK